jgi:hypothetical protein
VLSFHNIHAQLRLHYCMINDCFQFSVTKSVSCFFYPDDKYLQWELPQIITNTRVWNHLTTKQRRGLFRNRVLRGNNLNAMGGSRKLHKDYICNWYYLTIIIWPIMSSKVTQTVISYSWGRKGISFTMSWWETSKKMYNLENLHWNWVMVLKCIIRGVSGK